MRRLRRQTECPGTWEENFDGWPEVICDEVDKRHNEPICDECYEKRLATEANDALEAEAQDTQEAEALSHFQTMSEPKDEEQP